MQYQKKIKFCIPVLQQIACITFIVFFINQSSFAQLNNTYFFRHITQENGLIHNNVQDIAQDKRGFIWITTANGLQRYDGSRFVNYYDMLADPSQTSPGTASMYIDDKSNSLWINKSFATEKLNLTSNRLTFYKPEALLQENYSQFLKYKDSRGVLYLLSGKAIFTYDSVSKKFCLYSFNAKPFTKGVSSDFVTNPVTGETWMGSNVSGLTLFDIKTREIYTPDYNPNHNALLKAFKQQAGNNSIAIRRLMLDNHNNLWIATWGKLFYQYNAATGKLLSYSLSSIIKNRKDVMANDAFVAVSCFYQDDHHTIWMSTENAGLFRYNEAANSFEPVVINGRDKQSDAYNYNIFCIFQDREENIWLGTDKGITFFNPYRQYFQAIQHNENNAASLPKNEIECYIQTASGNMVAGTWGGGITVFDSNWNFKKTIRFPASPFELNLVWSLAQNNDGTIWAGCQHGYIHIYNPTNGTVHTIHPPEMNNFTIHCITKDQYGNLWFGLHDGKITEWNQQQQRFYADNDSSKTLQPYAPVNAIFFDKQQRCWVSTENGFKQFDTGKKQYVATYISDKNNPHAIASSATEGIEQYNDSTLVIATLHGGLTLFSPDTKRFALFTPGNDLRFSNSYAIKKDVTGLLWFTTDYGLYSYEEKDHTFTRYHFEPGLLNSAFKSTQFYPLHNGKWITSSATEIIDFLPQKQPSTKPGQTGIEITGVSVFNKAIPVDSLLAASEPLHLSYKQNFFTIEFAKLSFTPLHQTDYYYRLQGIDKDWVYAGGKPFATYTNLSPGSYVFDVKGEDDSNSSAITSLQIVIEPPFWKTWWFILLVAVFVFFVAYQLVMLRIKNFRTVEREKLNAQEAKIEMLSLSEKLSLAKLEALRSQMNPHFIFNCLTSIDNLIQTGEKEKATTYLAKFAKLIRSILETSKSNTVPCWKDMETLQIYLDMEELRSDKKFNYTITVADDIINGDYKVPPLVIQPFVENAIHHGLLNKRESSKELLIDVRASDNYIHYMIQDNGVGRRKAAEYQQLNKPSHQSMGLQISIDRIHLYNKNGNGAVTITDLFDEQQQPAGTKVEVNLINQP